MNARITSYISEVSSLVLTQRTVSGIVLFLVISMCAVVILTSGRAFATKESVASSIDDVGVRSVSVTAQPNSGLTTAILEGLVGVSAIETALGFSQVIDVHNTDLPAGNRIGMRVAYTRPGEQIAPGLRIGEGAYVSSAAKSSLQLANAAGSVTSDSGVEYSILGAFSTPSQLSHLDPLVLLPEEATGDEPLSSVVLVVDRADHVWLVTNLLRAMVVELDIGKITIQSSQRLAELQQTVENQLSGSAQSITGTVFLVCAFLVTITLLGVAVMRRKDYGRRRALGASRAFVAWLVLGHVVSVAFVGSSLGIGIGCIYLALTVAPIPNVNFLASLWWASIFIATVAAIFPALYASKRDPVHELRVP